MATREFDPALGTHVEIYTFRFDPDLLPVVCLSSELVQGWYDNRKWNDAKIDSWDPTTRTVTLNWLDTDLSSRVQPYSNVRTKATHQVCEDIARATPSDGTVRAFTKIGAVSSAGDQRIEDEDFWGSFAANIGDVDGDQTPDIAVSSWPLLSDTAVWILMLRPDGTVKVDIL